MPSGMGNQRHSSLSEQDQPPPGADAACYFMDNARQKYKKHPQLLEPVHLPKKIPTPEELDFDERLDRAIAQSNRHLQTAAEQLAAPCIAPAELTPSEKAEKASAEAWLRGYDIVNKTNDNWLVRNQHLSVDVMSAIDEMEIQNIPIPDIEVTEPPTPSIERLDIPDQAKYWLRGSWSFREYRDEDFVAAQRAKERSLLHPVAELELGNHGRASSEPARERIRGPAESKLWKDAESLGDTLRGKLAGSSLSIRHQFKSSVGAIALQNVFGLDKTIKW